MRLRIYQIIITTSKTQVTWLLFFAVRVIKVSRTQLFDLLRYRNFEVFPVLPEVEAFLLVLPARYEGEARGRKSEEKHEGRSGALPVTRFIFFELFFTSGRFSRELSERSERIILCLLLVPLFKSQYTNKFQSWSP